MKLGVCKRIGNAIRVGGSQLMRKVSIELERDKKMCSETLSSIWSGNASRSTIRRHGVNITFARQNHLIG